MNSWFSPLHLLIIEYVVPVSVIATIFLSILNTAQVPFYRNANQVIPPHFLRNNPTKR
jgi:hypothetical protein